MQTSFYSLRYGTFIGLAFLSWPASAEAQARTAGIVFGHYQLDKIGTAAGGRERVWTAGVRLAVPALAGAAELAAAAEYGIVRDHPQAPRILALRAEFVHMARSEPSAEVRPTLIAGLSVAYFRSTLFALTQTGVLESINHSVQVLGVGGIGFALRLSPALAVAPRVEGLVPVLRTEADPKSPIYLRWALNITTRF